MSFSIKKQGEIVVVDVEGQLIVGNRQELKQKVLDELERGERRFLIDFAQTGYIDSSGLGVLVSLSKKIREQGGELRLANLNEDLRTLFELTKLDTLFNISDSREDALRDTAPDAVRRSVGQAPGRVVVGPGESVGPGECVGPGGGFVEGGHDMPFGAWCGGRGTTGSRRSHSRIPCQRIRAATRCEGSGLAATRLRVRPRVAGSRSPCTAAVNRVPPSGEVREMATATWSSVSLVVMS